MIPVYKIEAKDKDITATIEKYLSSFRLTDAKGYESDSFEMTLTDANAEILWPDAEVKLKVWIGFKGEELIYKGEFVTDEVEFSGPPDHWMIKARAADMNSPLKAQKSRSWHDNNSVGVIIEFIAKQNKLKPAISKRFYQINVKHIDQTNESDMNFITRLAKKYDATAKVAGGSLIFTENGTAKTASGDDMPSFKLNLTETNDYRFTRSGKSDYSGVVALWHSIKSTLEHQQLVGEAGNVKTLKRKFASQAEAKNAAEAEYRRLARDKDTAEISVQIGRLAFSAECKFELVGWRDDIDKFWISKEVTHEFSKGSGLTTRLSLEKQQDITTTTA